MIKKLTNQQMVDSVNTLKELSTKKLPIKASYALAKNMTSIQREIDIYDSERQKLIESYAVRDEEGNLKVNDQGLLNIEMKHLDTWNKSIDELMAIEVEVNIHLIKLDYFESSSCEITPQELMLIDYLIEE